MFCKGSCFESHYKTLKSPYRRHNVITIWSSGVYLTSLLALLTRLTRLAVAVVVVVAAAADKMRGHPKH